MRRSMFVSLSTVSMLALGMAATPALAQTSDPSVGATDSNQAAPATNEATADAAPQAAAAEVPEDKAIVVTGTRIARPEIESAVPVAVVGQLQIQQDAAQNISDTLNELPQAAMGTSRTNTNFLTSGTGIATVDLRSLGTSRTLTLVNGRRFIGGFAGDSAVDLNNIPTEFIDRVEIVTGGSSAVYGSEAIAGVVNFILKEKYDGVGIRLQAGVTSRGDNPTRLVSVTAGQTLLDDRLSLLGNVSWDRDKGLRSRDRNYSDQDCGAIFRLNPITGEREICGPTAYSAVASQGRFQLFGPTGTARAILPGGNSQFTFNPDGSLVYGFPVGYGFNRNALRRISTPVDRLLLTGLMNFEVTPEVDFFTEATYSNVKSNNSIEPLAVTPASTGVNRIGIDNPFIPSAVAAAIAAANSDGSAANDVSSIDFGRRSNDIFDRSNKARRDTFRLATGFKGEIASKYNWELSYVYGRMHDFNASEDINRANYINALDAVRVGPGNAVGVDIVCRSVAARAAGCIPLNLFGEGTVDPRAADYVKAAVPRSEDIINKQNVFTASIAGPLFSMWAGDVSMAIGTEYRKEKTTDTFDELTRQGLNSGNQLTDLVGKYHVWEGFGELNVPLMKDLSFTKYLGLTGAARYSKYSTIGGVWSYNIGAEWQPIDDIRFRGMFAVANRAPNISELFSQPSQTFAAIADPCNGVTATTGGDYGAACRAIPGVAAAIAATGTFSYTLLELQQIDGFVGGNVDLSEERAKTKTIGAVFTPTFFPGFSATIDYYDIKLKDAIATLGRNFSVQQCLKTNNPIYCDTVLRNPTSGKITRVNGQLINVAGRRNRGVDVGLTYNRRLNLAPDDRLNLALNYTYLIDNKTQAAPTEDPVENAGTFGRAFSRHSFFGRASYKFGTVTVGWETNFLKGGDFLKDFFSTDPDVMALNKVDDYWMHGAQIRFDVSDKFSLSFNVDNIFDKQPPLLPNAAFGTPIGIETSNDVDLFGRRFTAGVRFGF